jgi:protein-L-isoaspartate(D-aspartate) O-methyltransferase
MIAIMLEALACQSTHRALEIGAGSGYAAALLAQLVDSVDAIELRPSLATMARHNLKRLGITNVAIHERDGSRGLPERGCYDRIMVSAGATRIPEALLAQLAPGGRIAIPVGAPGGSQRLHIGSNTPSGIEWTQGVACVFVPLVQSD